MTNAEFAILSLIVEAPKHGYEIEQIIEERGMRDWTEVGFSSIYYLLKKLKTKGYISSILSEDTGKGPARKVFSPTETGKSKWREISLESLRGRGAQTTPFLLGLAAIPALDPLEVRTALQENLANLLERKKDMRKRWEIQKPVPLHVDAMFQYSLALIEAEENWLKAAISQEKSHDS